MVNRKDQWLADNGVPFEVNTQKDKEITAEMNADFEESLKKEYGEMLDAVLDEKVMPDKELPTEPVPTVESPEG